MVFSWDDVNRDHIARHGVTSEEAEDVVSNDVVEVVRVIHAMDLTPQMKRRLRRRRR